MNLILQSSTNHSRYCSRRIQPDHNHHHHPLHQHQSLWIRRSNTNVAAILKSIWLDGFVVQRSPVWWLSNVRIVRVTWFLFRCQSEQNFRGEKVKERMITRVEREEFIRLSIDWQNWPIFQSTKFWSNFFFLSILDLNEMWRKLSIISTRDVCERLTENKLKQ